MTTILVEGVQWDTLRIRGTIQEYTHYALFKIKIMDSAIFTN